MIPPAPAPEPHLVSHPDRVVGGAAALLAAGTITIYSRTFSVPLLFDDQTWLTRNPSIRHLGAMGTVLTPPQNSGTGGRPLVNLLDALNYAAGGENVTGYHVVNLAIHVLAAWALFGLVRRTLLLPSMAERFGRAATALALAVGAIWAWHPVLTESVTYLAQRSEALMGLCYFLTLYCFVRGAGAQGPGGRRIWFSLSFLSCLAGTGSKEVIVTAPLLVFLYDRTFVSGSFAQAWRRHWAVHLALAATWIPLGLLMAGLALRGVGYGPDVSGLAYALVECRVMVKYLVLAFWPRPLVFDYGAFVPAPWSSVWPFALLLAGLLAATAVAVRRAPAVGFAACWFFLILAPASSVVPVFTQPMAENRLYLPVAGVVALAVLGIFTLAGRRSLPGFAVFAVFLGAASVARNEVYRTAPGIWEDTVAKVPQSPRAHSNLGAVLILLPDRVNDAVVEYAAAARLQPLSAKAHNDLGNVLGRAGRLEESRAEYEEAIRCDPGLADAHESLGSVWMTLRQPEKALVEYRATERLRPKSPGVHNDLGNALYYEPGRMADAIAEYHEALRLDPNFSEAHGNLGNALLTQPGQLENAVAEYETSIRLKPGFAGAHVCLAVALLRLPGRGAEARAELETALRLHPGDPAARRILASLPPAGT